MTAVATVLGAAAAVLGVLSMIWAERARRRTQRLKEIERTLAAQSITLKPGEVIPPLESLTQRPGRTNRITAAPTERNRGDSLEARRLRLLKMMAGSARNPGTAARPAWPANGLAGVASLLLPIADRARYSEEYRSELWDLAQAGAGRIRQLLYALRQIRNARPTSSALRSPRRKSSAP
jgi:hypothetical protein